MHGLANNPVLQPDYITKVIDDIVPDNANYMLNTEVPMVTQSEGRITVEVRQTIGGMTKAVDPSSESPIIEQRGRQLYDFDPPNWREKVVFGPKDVLKVRKVGSISEIQTAQDLVTDYVGQLRMRLENRIEWSKWQCMLGTLTIAQSDVQFSIDYGIPAHFTPTLTGTDSWDELTTADPLSDMLTWKALYLEEGPDPWKLNFNSVIERLLMLNEKIRALFDSFFVGPANDGMIGQENLFKIIKAYVGLESQVYDKGYFVVARIEEAITTVSTDFDVNDASGIETGDTVTLIHKNGERSGRVRIVVTGITGNNIQHAAIGGSTTFPMYSEIKLKKPFLPNDKFVIRGTIPPGTTGGTAWAEFVSVPHVYGSGGLSAPEAGIFSKVVNKPDDDPPELGIIGGISGGPALYHTTTNVIATVY